MANPTKHRIGVIIGRFQTYALTEGHLHLINTVLSQCDDLLILVGSTAISRTKRNPLDFKTIKLMLQGKVPQAKICKLIDTHNNVTWSAQVDRIIEEQFSPGISNEVTLYGSRDSFIPFYVGENKVKEIEPLGDASGTDYRKNAAQESLDSDDFRKGMIYAINLQYPSVYPTVDVAVVDNILNPKMVLLGRKPNDIPGKYRFPGGFVEPTDGTFEAAAIKEVMEETNVNIGNLNYIGTFLSGDKRYEKEDDKIITTLFIAQHVTGVPLGGDDLEEAKWFNIDRASLMELIIDGHSILMDKFLNRIGK